MWVQPACFGCLLLVQWGDGRYKYFDLIFDYFFLFLVFQLSLVLVEVVVVYNTELYSVEVPILFSILV